MSHALSFHYLMLNVFRMLIHPSSGACDLFVELFHALLFNYLMLNVFRMLIHPSSGAATYLLSYFMSCIALVRCVLVLRCGNHNVTPTHIEPEQYNS